MTNILRIFALLGILLLLPGCMRDDLPFLPEPQTHYTIEGLEHDEKTQNYIQTILKNRLAVPLDSKDKDEQSRAIAYRERMIRSDLHKAMESQGYYKSVIHFHEGQDKSHGRYVIDPGPLYTIQSLAIEPENYKPLLESLPLAQGDALKAQNILEAQNLLLSKIEKKSCALKLNVSHKVILPPDQTQAAVIFYVETGPDMTFGPLIFEGQETVKTAYLEKLVPWTQGDCLKRKKIDTLRKKLLSGGLFSQANIKTGAPDPNTNAVPITVQLKEKAQRTVKAGLSYYTDEGPGAILEWQHRNFFGKAEKFTAGLTLSALEQSLDLALTKPFFLRDDQSLTLTGTLSREDTDAYQELGIGTGFRIKRKFKPKLSGSLGADIKFSNIEEDDGTEENFGLVSGIASVVFDTRDNTLDPHKGWLASIQTQPFIDILGQSSPFLKSSLSASTYYEINKRSVLAARAHIGSIAGTNTADVPATKRFYAGGGGSVRGFGYQEIGPIEDNDPVGGRSLVEFSTEFRYKVTDKIGAVAFVDTGNVSEHIAPAFDDIAVGAGLGLRYYTSFGPIRFDVATPLAGDENVDQNYQIYISIGQAF